MKSIKFIFIALVVVLINQSCEDNLLDKAPLDAISEETFFTKASDYENYVNGLYGIVIRKQSGNRWNGAGSDDKIGTGPSGNLMKRNASGQAPETSGAWNNAYTNIRKVNFMLENKDKIAPTDESNHYVGEAYFIRAWVYFGLLKQFGDVPYYTEVLSTDSEELYRTRTPRDVVTSNIIADLDTAIQMLYWKNTGPANVEGRINKEAALTLKTRVGLFEGSWEKYHGQKGTAFAVSGQNGTQFLQAAVEAGDMLIDKMGNKVFTGVPGWEYNGLWDQAGYKAIPEAFLVKVYADEPAIRNNWGTYSAGGWDKGITQDCVDQYLDKEGKPQAVSNLPIDSKSLLSLGENLDPRYKQSVWDPANGTLRSMFPPPENGHAYNTSMPGLITNQQRWPTLTGYRIWKGTIRVPAGQNMNTEDDLIMRYGEALMNYAEARAILGQIDQSHIDKSINVLRGRVGMPQMVLADLSGWGLTYDKKYGYEPSEPAIVNEIRRERRVELLLEGFRHDDIRRWALMDEVYNGLKPRGAGLQQFLDYWNDPAKLAEEGFVYSKPAAVKLTPGNNCEAFADGHINPFFKNADFKSSGTGYFIDESRDYLSPIGRQEIELYEAKAGVVLEQNPGWF